MLHRAETRHVPKNMVLKRAPCANRANMHLSEANSNQLDPNSNKIEANMHRLEPNSNKIDPNRHLLKANSNKIETNRHHLESNSNQIDANRLQLDPNSNMLEANRCKIEAERGRIGVKAGGTLVVGDRSEGGKVLCLSEINRRSDVVGDHKCSKPCFLSFRTQALRSEESCILVVSYIQDASFAGMTAPSLSCFEHLWSTTTLLRQ